jgi:membrane protein involved in D-alanine export
VIPYADFLSLGLLLYLIVPVLVLGALGGGGRLRRGWVVAAIAIALAAQFRVELGTGPLAELRSLWLMAGFVVFQGAVAWGYLHVRTRTRRGWLTVVAVLLALLPLVSAKLLPALAPGTVIGFLGLSYVTFRALDVLLAVHDGLVGSLAPASYLGYLVWFPTISAGPIDRYRRFLADWKHDRTRGEFLQDLDSGLHRIMTGFLYKFILAALIQRYWLDPAAGGSGPLALASYMYAYSLYLFFDFAGYSAFAIGVSHLFGFHPPENFRRPFLARDIRDFWDRWHVSLSTWLRDHIYMRFVLAATRRKWFRDRHTASYLGFLLAFGLMGLWHGPEPHYLLYGLYHAALLIGHDRFARWNKRRWLWGEGPAWRAAGTVVTVQAVCFGFLLFSGRLGPALAALVR